MEIAGRVLQALTEKVDSGQEVNNPSNYVQAAVARSMQNAGLWKPPPPPAEILVERCDIEPLNDSLIFQPNEQTLEGSFSSVSTPNFASKYSLESS